MDIDLLSKMVKELILDNDRVTLPGLGCFVAEIVPSTFSDKGYTINPPYRKLYFRAKPDAGNALAKLYAKSNGIQLEIAEGIISDFVSELKAVLFERKTVVFPGLGRLRATKENAVFFVADEDLDIYPDGFGLESISMKTHVETKEEVTQIVKELKAVVDEPMQVIEEPQAEEAQVDEPQTEEPQAVEMPEVEMGPQTENACNESEPQKLKKKCTFWRCLGKTILWLVLISALLLGAFIAISRYRPDITDKLLYTPDELEILETEI